jgi:hypothetical protein
MIALQGFQVLFLWVHDWVPLGSLNDVAAIRRADSRQRLVVVTLIQSARIMFGKTHSFLPLHNDLVPNTAHILLHVSTAVTLILLLTYRAHS